MQKSYHLYITESKSRNALYSVILTVRNGKPKITDAYRMRRGQRNGKKFGSWVKASKMGVEKVLGLRS